MSDDYNSLDYEDLYVDSVGQDYVKKPQFDNKASYKDVILEIIQLNKKIEKLMIITEALWIALKENTNYTDEDLKQIMREVDLKDGKEDSKVESSTSGKCPVCKQPLQKNKDICIYCGAKIEPDIFER